MVDVILLLLPAMSAAAVWAFRWFEQFLPEKRRQTLEYFANIAVRCIEQKYDGQNGPYKKSQAATLIYGLHQTSKMKSHPDQMEVDAMIEKIVWELNQAKIPDEFTTDKMPSLNTGPIKPVPPGGTPV